MSAELISHIVAICVSFGVGFTVLHKGWRARDMPAILLGAAVAIDGFEWLCWSLCAFVAGYETPLGNVLSATCRLGITASIICMLFFTRAVFRPRARWATGILWALIAAMLAGFVGSGTLDDWGGWRNDHIWNWIELFAQIAAYGWTTAEPFAYYVKMKKRVAHGFADPVIANRMFLWSLYAGMFMLTQIGYGVVLALFEDLAALDTILVGFTIAGEVALWVAFFPPEFYLRWLGSGSSAAE